MNRRDFIKAVSVAPVALLAAPVVAQKTFGQKINEALADGRLSPLVDPENRYIINWGEPEVSNRQE